MCVRVNLNEVMPIPDREGNLRILLSPKKGSSTHAVLGHSILEPGQVVTGHIHDYSDELFFVIKGSGLLSTEEKEIAFSERDAVCIPKGISHRIFNNGKVNLEVVFCVSPLAPSPELGHRELTT